MKQYAGRLLGVGLVAIIMIVHGTASLALAADGTLTILATSDIHSTLMPYGAYLNGEYTKGGFLRLAERIIEIKTQHLYEGHNVLVLDAGDSVAGTFFHYAYKGLAEMALMGGLYDATTIGNHDFDWTPDAMAGAMQSLLAQGGTPPVFVSSNIVDWGDSSLQGFWGTFIVPYMMKDINGMKVGIFGLMTRGTAALGQPSPLSFTDLSTEEGIFAALSVASMLQTMEADVIVLLAHNGLNYDTGLAYYAALNGIKLDVIISGHDHIANPAVFKFGNTHILQVGAYTEYIGSLTMTVQNKQITNYGYVLEGINSENPDINGEPMFSGVNPAPTAWTTLVEWYTLFANPAMMAHQIAQPYPAGWGEATTADGTWGDFSGGAEQAALGVTPYIWQWYSILEAFNQMTTTLFHATPPYGDETPDDWYQIPAVTQMSLVKTDYAEHNLGDLISDSMFLRGTLVDFGDPTAEIKGLPGSPNDDVTDFAVEANGTIRSDILLDENGITTSDAYQVLSLGIGLKSFDIVNGDLPLDDQGRPMYSPGFDLMRFYMLGADMKKAMELGVAAEKLGDIFFLNWSGLTFDYDLSKEIGERVSNVKVAHRDIIDTAYYKGTTSTYVGSSFLMLPVMLQPAVTSGVLTQEQYEFFSSMKIYLNRQGTQITDIMGTLIYTYCGKQWLAFADKIMWPWWYGGMNGTISRSTYGNPDNRMNDITPSTFRIDMSAKKNKWTAPTVITRLNGRKTGDPGFLTAYDLNRDGVIDHADLALALSLAR